VRVVVRRPDERRSVSGPVGAGGFDLRAKLSPWATYSGWRRSQRRRGLKAMQRRGVSDAFKPMFPYSHRVNVFI
jgi:hypothetical protein